MTIVKVNYTANENYSDQALNTGDILGPIL